MSASITFQASTLFIMHKYWFHYDFIFDLKRPWTGIQDHPSLHVHQFLFNRPIFPELFQVKPGLQKRTFGNCHIGYYRMDALFVAQSTAITQKSHIFCNKNLKFSKKHKNVVKYRITILTERAKHWVHLKQWQSTAILYLPTNYLQWWDY